jgi:hypothetical protein
MRPQTPGMAASHEVPTLQMASHVPIAPAQPLSWQAGMALDQDAGPPCW